MEAAGRASDVFEEKDLAEPNNLMRIKFCLAGAFNKFTMKSDIYDAKEMQKMRNYLAIESLDAKRTLVIEDTIFNFQHLSPHDR